MVDFMNNSKAAEDMRNDGIAAANFYSLNCIDLSSPDIHTSVSLLKQAPLSLSLLLYACLDSGFFCVINHGISQEFMDEVLAQSKKFFDLPLEEKMKLLRNEKHRGYTPCLDEHLDAVNQINGDYKEGYYIGVEVPEDDPESQKPFYGSNVWPAAGTLPGWRETMQKYHQEALEVVKGVSRLIALALDLDVDFFDQPELLGRPIATLRLLHYEGKLSDPSNGIFGAGAHSDYGLITLLATDNVCGLQISKDKDANPQIWEYVPPLKGAFIVNLGDMLERWSNGIFSRITDLQKAVNKLLQVNTASGPWKWSREIFYCIFCRTQSRLSCGMLANLPIKSKPTKASILQSNVTPTCYSVTKTLMLIGILTNEISL
ncbi:putative protein phosphatase 1 regulatory subunit pprA-like [Capsicum annuum]|nr:putative protein phosphatase 1 regulatory subunit pprA-like [Capsicum annuum]